jgi:uncharacterized integral membrane protein
MSESNHVARLLLSVGLPAEHVPLLNLGPEVANPQVTSIAIQAIGARNDDAGRCLRWATQATQALDYLKDLHKALPKSRELPDGHDVLAIQVAHARWASATSMTAIDLCAAALGYLYLPRRGKDAYYDFRLLRKKITTVRTHPGTTEWIDQVNNNADFKLIDGIRDPIAYRKRWWEADGGRVLVSEGAGVHHGQVGIRSTVARGLREAAILRWRGQVTDTPDPRTSREPYPTPGADEPSGPSSVPAANPPAPPVTVQAANSTPGPAAGFDSKGRVRRTRSGAAWVGLIAAAVFLILLIIFIAQNTGRVSIKFLGLNGHMSLGLTILISAIVGLLIAAVPGTIRILQLRRSLKRNTPAEQRSGT